MVDASGMNVKSLMIGEVLGTERGPFLTGPSGPMRRSGLLGPHFVGLVIGVELQLTRRA